MNDKHLAVGDPGASPSDLDVSLCMKCGQFSLFCVHDDGQVHLNKPPGGVGYAHVANVLQDAG